MFYLHDLGFDKVSPLLSTLSQQLRLVSTNLANAHTPGYTAKSATFAELMGLSGGPFETRMSSKMGPAPMLLEMGGDPVNMQRELVQLQQVNLHYGMVTRRLSTVVSLMRNAAQVGR